MFTKIKAINMKYVVATVAVLVGVVGLGVFVGYPSSKTTFDVQGEKYECSKNVSGRTTITGFKPSNLQEFDKFCRIYAPFPGLPEECAGIDVPTYCHTIEYRAVLDILRRDDVARIIEKYDTTRASVRALGHTYIDDKEYLTRILPAYSDVKIDCIIVVHSPEGTRFFIEDGEKHESHHDHHYREVPADEFLASLNSAPDTDVTNFWLGLH